MPNLTHQKRVASEVLKCGRNRIWLDPNETSEIALANSRKQIRKLFKDGLIMRRRMAPHSRYRIRKLKAAKAKGRHTGTGKREGTANARISAKVLWIRRIRVLRRLLKKCRDNKKITKHIYRNLYKRVKGNQFKNKFVLIETIHKEKVEKGKEKKELIHQLEAKKKMIKEKEKEKIKEKEKDKDKEKGKEVVKDKDKEKTESKKEKKNKSKAKSNAPKETSKVEEKKTST